MVAQRSGMVSSDNPLSTTTKLYQNNFESKRQMPSVANTQRMWGEQKDNYQRTGTESKNNPFSHQVDNYYQSYSGKKIDEIPERPQQKPPKFKVYML
jgi:calcyphosin